MSEKSRKLLIKASGGMGNRMLCAVTGLIYGRLASRSAYIDWSDGVYGDPGHNAFHDFFTIKDVPAAAPMPVTEDVYPEIWRGNLERSVSNMMGQYSPNSYSSKFIHQKYSLDVRNLNYENEGAVFWNYSDRIGFLRRHLNAAGNDPRDRRQILRDFLQNDLLLRSEIRKEIDSYKEQNWTSNMIGVHVRYSDRKVSLNRFERALERLTKTHQDATIFLATDNADVETHFRNRFKRVITRTKWLPTAGVSLHAAKTCPDKHLSAVEALIDMYLLSECHCIVFPGRSTFSAIASILMSESHEILDVERWDLQSIFARWVRNAIP